jgi:hypothetical protein
MPRQASPAASCRSCRTLGCPVLCHVVEIRRTVAAPQVMRNLARAARPLAVSAPHVAVHEARLVALLRATALRLVASRRYRAFVAPQRFGPPPSHARAAGELPVAQALPCAHTGAQHQEVRASVRIERLRHQGSLSVATTPRPNQAIERAVRLRYLLGALAVPALACGRATHAQFDEAVVPEKADAAVVEMARANLVQRVIVTLDYEAILERQNERVQARRLPFAGQREADETAAEFTAMKQEVFPRGSLGQCRVLQSFSHLPSVVVEVPNTDCLLALDSHPKILRIHENKQYRPIPSPRPRESPEIDRSVKSTDG